MSLATFTASQSGRTLSTSVYIQKNTFFIKEMPLSINEFLEKCKSEIFLEKCNSEELKRDVTRVFKRVILKTNQPIIFPLSFRKSYCFAIEVFSTLFLIKKFLLN